MQHGTCCFTGHRHLPTDRMEGIVKKLDRETENLIANGVTNFISGGALGFDQIAASMIVTKKKRGKDLRLLLALPCKKQDEFWTDRQRTFYKHLLRAADETIYISEAWDIACMKKRNLYMVDHSMYCICAFLYEASGTGQTVRFAQKRGLQIINVAK